jgi:serine/threonine-protein kinase HipA
VLADALPDAFGTQVIRAYYTARGRRDEALSPVQHLLYLGSRGIGALEFHPAEALPGRAAEAEALEVAELVADARRIIAGEAGVAIPEIYRIGSSAGGMRPKAVVLYNPASGVIRSAFAVPGDGDIHAILKFDGVGERTIRAELGEPEPYNRVEAAYSAMSRDAGIDVVEIRIVESELGHAHLVIPRFDRPRESPLHQHTLGGLLHLDYNDVGASSYEEYLRTILGLGMPHAAVLEGYRRMAFNVMAVNQDDHVKNLSFHMDAEGVWRLTPAYDVTFARGGAWTAAHQMRVADKRSGITRGDLIGVARDFGIRAPHRILDRIAEALGRWPEYAQGTGVPRETMRAIQEELDRRAKELR